MTAATCQHHAPNGSSANQAGLALAAINPVLELKKSFFSIGIDIIGNRRPALRDCLAKPLGDRLMQFGELLPGDRSCPPPRTNPPPKYRFGGINVSHASQQFLIQKRAFDRSLAPPEQSDESLL